MKILRTSLNLDRMRCSSRSTESMIAYHDKEWGVPVHDDRLLFEFLILEGAQAGLSWSIGKRRRTEGGFPGAASILEQIAQGPPRKRVGIRPDGRAPARENTEITDLKGGLIGKVTSGGFGPTVGGPICMGYVHSSHAAAGIEVQLVVRGTPRSARIVELPFVPHRYIRN